MLSWLYLARNECAGVLHWSTEVAIRYVFKYHRSLFCAIFNLPFHWVCRWKAPLWDSWWYRQLYDVWNDSVSLQANQSCPSQWVPGARSIYSQWRRRRMKRLNSQEQIQSGVNWSCTYWTVTYLDSGSQMLNLARNFLMVPLGLNQLCLFFCWTTMFSFVRCFHSWAMKTVRILGKRSEGLFLCHHWSMNKMD